MAPARVMPTGGAAQNPVGNHGSMDAAAAHKKQMSELTLCFSLCSLFDFDKTGFISHEDWQRGMATLMLQDLGDDPKIWQKMTEMHGTRDGGKAFMDVSRLSDIVPIDPRVAVLLNAIVKGLVGMREFVTRSYRKEEREGQLKQNRALLNIRRRIVEPVLQAWKALTKENRKLFKYSVMQARYYVYFKAWRTWKWATELCREEAAEQRRQERKLRRIGATTHAHAQPRASFLGSWPNGQSPPPTQVPLRRAFAIGRSRSRSTRGSRCGRCAIAWRAPLGVCGIERSLRHGTRGW